MACPFRVRDRVQKVGGDYSFEGEVVSVFRKRSGTIRLVVEDDRGLLFIFNATSLQATTIAAIAHVEEDSA